MTFINNPIYVLMILCLVIVLGVYTAKTEFGGKFGAALIIILLAALLANLKLIPSASNSINLYSSIFKYVAPISIFYLLLNVNLSSIKQAGFPMIGLFLIGSLATTLGILLSWFILSPQNVLGEDGKIIAGMLTGTYTGGSLNFNAIALEYNLQKKGILYAGTIAVDNVITTFWIIATLVFPTFLNRIWKRKKDIKVKNKTLNTAHQESEGIDLTSLVWLIFLGIAAFYLSDILSHFINQIPSILILSTIGIVLAQTKFVAKLKGSRHLGLYLVYLFCSVIGVYCELNAVSALKEIGIILFQFTSLAVLLHGLILIFIGGFLYRDWEMIAIISQANVGGAPTAIALAETFNRKELIVPAILVGSLGNALGSYLGFFVVFVL
tara:strand:+ start:1649 stop:2791 length:1143 start_codon:yes stop_codon:yes gene_type:complete